MEFKVKTEVRVRFADVDSLGHANNAKFFTYFEQARVTFFKKILALDFTQNQSPPAHSVILASIRADFRSPAYLDEVLEVKIRTRQLGRSSFIFDYEITEQKTQRLVATGESTQVYYDYQKNKSVPLPNALRQEFEKIEERTF